MKTKQLTKQDVALVCFQILGRHFPGPSNSDSEELRKVLGVDSSVDPSPYLTDQTAEAAIWKAAACKWLVNNISFKKGQKDRRLKIN
jgi:hypothetical protein